MEVKQILGKQGCANMDLNLLKRDTFGDVRLFCSRKVSDFNDGPAFDCLAYFAKLRENIYV